MQSAVNAGMSIRLNASIKNWLLAAGSRCLPLLTLHVQ